MGIPHIPDARNRRNRNDGTSPTLYHAWQDLLATEHQALDIHCVYAIQVLSRGLHRTTGLPDTDVVMQDVDLTMHFQ